MKILQLNCWSGKLGGQIIKLIKKENPDIVCLQETTDLSLRPGSLVTPFRALLPENKFPYAYFDPVFSYRFMHEIAGFGNAIVSKLPFLATTTLFTKGSFHADLDNLKDDYNIRNMLDIVVTCNKKRVHILTHHGHHEPGSKEGGIEHMRQNKLIASYIVELNEPVVLTGDFNVHPKSRSLQPLTEGLRDLCSEYKVTSTRTEVAKRQEVIDYIFVSPEIKVVTFSAADDLVSDHKALILEFQL